MDRAGKAPYAFKSCRRNIDICTFTLYNHWVKKNEGMGGQNRAAMFQHKQKVDEKMSLSWDATNNQLDTKVRRPAFTMFQRKRKVGERISSCWGDATNDQLNVLGQPFTVKH